MKLSRDCIRDVLMYLESIEYVVVDDYGNTSFDMVDIDDIYSEFTKWSKQDILYSISNLSQAGFIKVLEPDNCIVPCPISVLYITYKGHEFLDKIRDEKRWRLISKSLSSIRDYSIDAICAIANGVTSAAIAAYLQKNDLKT